MKRRSLLKATLSTSLGTTLCTSAGLALGVVEGVFDDAVKAQSSNSSLTALEVQDNLAAPLLNQGQLVLADTTVQHFNGNGLYLYPDWGKPRAYQVSQSGSQLQFSFPGQKQVLWTQSSLSQKGISTFSGKVIGVTTAEQLSQADIQWAPLILPA